MTEKMTARYRALKERHPDALLIFREGQRYELFREDAVQASRTLGLTLQKEFGTMAEDTSRTGFSRRDLDTYLPRLIRAGLRVAICDPIDDGGEEGEI